MTQNYGRDLDLNLLRVFLVVAETGSVTAAAERLYLTQPAVSAALRRLTQAVGAPLFARAGRGIALSARGERLLGAARPHVEALVEAALSPSVMDAKSSERTLRLGLSDTGEAWLLPPLLRALATDAPRVRVVVIPVQFRTVGEAFTSGRIDVAVTVADDVPSGVERRALFFGGFVCLFDPRHARLGRRPSLERYLEHDHVIVSYNGDLRGIVEDYFGVQRRVRVSVPTFHSIGGIVDGSALVATVPAMVAHEVRGARPHLKVAAVPLALTGSNMELLWRKATEDDAAIRLVLDRIGKLAVQRARALGGQPARATSD